MQILKIKQILRLGTMWFSNLRILLFFLIQAFTSFITLCHVFQDANHFLAQTFGL